MGHDLRIHREYYPLPEGTLEAAKVSKILHILNTGRITHTDAAKLHDENVQTFVGKYSHKCDGWTDRRTSGRNWIGAFSFLIFFCWPLIQLLQNELYCSFFAMFTVRWPPICIR